MRYLILSCNTGEGHNSAAKAVADSFLEKNIECVIEDALAFWSPEKSNVISKGHIFLYRYLPKLFGFSYRFEENHPAKEGEDSIIYELVIRGCKSLYDYLCEKKFDGIICTHVFPAMMITEIKKRYNLQTKSYFIATDYTCSPGVSETRMDTYFLPHKALKKEFMDNGIPEEKLCSSGIPIRKSFYTKVEASKAKKTLSLPADKKIVLLACGSMGCGPIKELTELLIKSLSEDYLLVVICGNNRKLYRSLTENFPAINLRVVGYTKRMSLYMDAASFILTKPGGLSSTEASVKALPMIFINAVPGCETRNIEFFNSFNLAEIRNTLQELADLVREYANDPMKRKTISEKLKAEFNECAADVIRDYVLFQKPKIIEKEREIANDRL